MNNEQNNGKFPPFKKRSNPLDSHVSPMSSPIKSVAANDRVKYTATMDKELRKRLKYAAAKRDIQISQYIEEAVMARLERDGE